MFYTCNYNIRVTHRNGAIKHLFTNQIRERDHQQIVLYSFLSLHALALHLAVKILLQIFLYEDLSVGLTYINGCISPELPAGPFLCYATNILSENIPNI